MKFRLAGSDRSVGAAGGLVESMKRLPGTCFCFASAERTPHGSVDLPPTWRSVAPDLTTSTTWHDASHRDLLLQALRHSHRGSALFWHSCCLTFDGQKRPDEGMQAMSTPFIALMLVLAGIVIWVAVEQRLLYREIDKTRER